MLGLVHVRVATVQVHPAGPVNDTTVVFAGSVSVRLTLVAVLGPEFVTTCVYVMLLPALTGTGAAVFVTDISADVPTIVLTVAVLLPDFTTLLCNASGAKDCLVSVSDVAE